MAVRGPQPRAAGAENERHLSSPMTVSIAASAVASPAPGASSRLADAEADALVRSMGIPPRPATLMDLQAEIGKEDPDSL